MSNVLNQKTVSAASDLAYLQCAITRPASDTVTDYTDAAVSLLLWRLDNRTSVAINPIDADLTLTVNNGLTRIENEEDNQVLTVAVTQAELTTLLNGDLRRRIGYRWVFQPVVGPSTSGFVGTEFDGIFTLVAPGIQSGATLR